MCEKLVNLKKTELKIAKLLQKNILSAKELQNILNVDKTTIYRNLNSLLKKKIIREIKNSNGVVLFFSRN
jgi:Fur family ferric uptake transcriptional regulator